MSRISSPTGNVAPGPKTRRDAASLRPSRSEKARRIREDLLHAAAQVIGEQGYLNAQVQAITTRAGVANGTFYNYFRSRQDLFDQLLPLLGREMLAFIADRSDPAGTEIDREVARFRAFFDYLELHPEFYRVLYEGEVFAPEAFDMHMRQVAKGFSGVLRHEFKAGRMTGYSPRELDTVALILMGARHYVATRALQDGGGGAVTASVTRAYAKFVTGGLRALATDAA